MMDYRFQSGGSLIGKVVVLLLVVYLVKSFLLTGQGFSLGVESNVLEHFMHRMEGISLSLGGATAGPPTDDEVITAFSQPATASLKQGKLVSADFEDHQRQFYLFIKGQNDKNWVVINKARTDYEGERKIWLAHVSEGLLWRPFSAGNHEEKVVILGAAGEQGATPLSDRQVLQELPTTLKYTQMQIIALRRY